MLSLIILCSLHRNHRGPSSAHPARVSVAAGGGCSLMLPPGPHSGRGLGRGRWESSMGGRCAPDFPAGVLLFESLHQNWTRASLT